MSLVRFGFVGCGRVADCHLNPLKSGDIGAELVAVCDIDEAKARHFGEKYGVPHYLDYHRMMEAHPDIQAVDVATHSGAHAAVVVELAAYGVHVVVEKPMALTVPDCQAMIEACRRGGGRLFVVKQNRFNPAVVAARQAFEAGRFGKMVMGTARTRWYRDQAYYDQDAWRGTWALDGGVMANQAIHHLDLLQWFMGEVETVNCHIATRLLDIEVEDTAVAILRFASGALGIFEASNATRPHATEASLSLLGEKGSAVVGGACVNEITHWSFTEALAGDEDVATGGSTVVPSVYGFGHGPFLGNVVEAINTGGKAMVEGGEGMRGVAILAALYESAANGGIPVAPGTPCVKSRLGRA